MNNYRDPLEIAKELKDTIYNLPWYFNLFGIKSKLKRLVRIVYFDMQHMVDAKNTRLFVPKDINELKNYFKNLK